MRLDKFLCDALGATRKEATKILKSGEVTVDEQVQKSGAFKVSEQSVVEWQGRELAVQGPRYIMLYKPEGFVCSHEDGFNHTAFVLLDEIKMDELHFAGRLDVDTTGLVLITDDGKWSHRITSPKHKCDKTYRVWLADPIGSDYQEKLAAGIQLRNEKELTLPAQMTVVNQAENELLLTIHEGKYHQVKRMIGAAGGTVTYLKRLTIGHIDLTGIEEVGSIQDLTIGDIEAFKK